MFRFGFVVISWRLLCIRTVESSTSSAAGQSVRLPRGAVIAMESDDEVIGGGDINEKKRFNSVPVTTDKSYYDPCSLRPHLWHALEGLDRYPNYLSRWSDDDIDRLQNSLEEKLILVRQQKQAVQRKRDSTERIVQELLQSDDGEKWKSFVEIPATWKDVRDRILDPRASRAIFRSKMFANSSIPTPTVLEVLAGQVAIELDVAQLQVLMDEELPDVFSFRLLSKNFCEQLREYVMALSRISQTTPLLDTDLGRRPFNLDMVRLGWLNDLLFQLITRPISRHLFQSTETLEDLDWRHGFVTGYSAKPTIGKPRERLVTHTDDSEVTLNVCLGAEFEGGLLEFRGLRGDDDETELMGTFQPQTGLAIVHAGRKFHDVTQVTAGDRFALIMWARAWKGARAVACPCCWLNRRNDNSCVCGPRWN